jgi:hypothetical protein
MSEVPEFNDEKETPVPMNGGEESEPDDDPTNP